ncbi:hydroxyisourate hydrolase [Virgibacillus dakarensis]|uniref:5-hydroxyisourate hydrolase n=1 Tax=Lentibacillus populi TaxID=1827502 RepID=A0A9W5TX36_9BACI|nr:hydroxyisourate hydrolase [Lentibacillus populi]MBT2218619.1 hydroxyisourate hydrolase [Virgibacillus dakarensis]MTW87470.1 hydroxyisourate hydrolase [Virgibacillus dakarensis]GGB37433.1 5-hydroxyisourate hydrolase [Lentibacillus populi]
MSLSTHVLDTVQGSPAKGMKIELWHLGINNHRTLIRQVETNNDGRVDTPLLTEGDAKPGEYELIFYVAEYFLGRGEKLSEPPFLDKVPIRFGIADPGSHYHVPLLITPWSYSTYRGS